MATPWKIILGTTSVVRLTCNPKVCINRLRSGKKLNVSSVTKKEQTKHLRIFLTTLNAVKLFQDFFAQ